MLEQSSTKLGEYKHSTHRPEIIKAIRDTGIKRPWIIEFGAGEGKMALHPDMQLMKPWYRVIEPFAPCPLADLPDNFEWYTETAEHYTDRINVPLNIKADFCIFADSLEHMNEPMKVLKWCRKALHERRGRVIVSVPNIGSFEAIQAIMIEGDFPYRDAGIFDRTHRWWFTEDSLLRTLREAGFELENFIPINVIYYDTMADALKKLAEDPEYRYKNFTVASGEAQKPVYTLHNVPATAVVSMSVSQFVMIARVTDERVDKEEQQQ